MVLDLQAKQSLDQYSLIGISTAMYNSSANQSAVAGLAEIKNPIALTSASQFLVYSITKTFIATLILLQCEQDKLKLTDLLAEWFPNIPNSKKITIEHLLNHTSGLPDYGSLSQYHEDVKNHPLEPWSTKEFLDKTLAQSILFEPGEGWGYSNIGYMLLVQILEAIESKTFGEILNSQILSPLHFENTFLPTSAEELHNLTFGYSKYLAKDPTILVDVRFNYHPGWVSHRVIASTPSDIAKFLYNLFNAKIINLQSLKHLTVLTKVPHKHPRFKDPSYCLGLMADPECQSMGMEVMALVIALLVTIIKQMI